MSKHIRTRDLAKQIEILVQEFIASGRLAAVVALERAFAGAARGGLRSPRHRQSSSRNVRRSHEEIMAMSERLYHVICSKPGQGMTVFASALDVSPRELVLPVANLKSAGQIRTVGQKRYTRYFPMVKPGSKSS